MASGWWAKPVPVWVGSNTTQHVTRPLHAADLLLHDWQEAHGPAYERAKVALLTAIENPGNANLSAESRSAFEGAAREARVLMGE